jgi:hypothetical protein
MSDVEKRFFDAECGASRTDETRVIICHLRNVQTDSQSSQYWYGTGVDLIRNARIIVSARIFSLIDRRKTTAQTAPGAMKIVDLVSGRMNSDVAVGADGPILFNLRLPENFLTYSKLISSGRPISSFEES